MLRKFRFVIAAIAIIAANQAASYAVSASMAQTYIPAGTTRYALASATAEVLYAGSTFKDVPGMATSITIPTGKHGDVMVLFCGDVASLVDVQAQVLVGGAAATPGIRELGPRTDAAYGSRCAAFYKTGATAGTKLVKVQWKPGSVGTIGVHARTMLVTVNVR
jgi:hypothetical protein